jgi:hypothetical protein
MAIEAGSLALSTPTATATTTTTIDNVDAERELAKRARAQQLSSAFASSMSDVVSLYETRMRAVQESQMLFSNQLDCLDQGEIDILA